MATLRLTEIKSDQNNLYLAQDMLREGVNTLRNDRDSHNEIVAITEKQMHERRLSLRRKQNKTKQAQD